MLERVGAEIHPGRQRPMEIIEVKGVQYRVPFVIRESQGPIDTTTVPVPVGEEVVEMTLEEWWNVYLANGNYERNSVNSTTVGREAFWGGFARILPRFKGGSPVAEWGIGPGIIAEKVLENSPHVRLVGFDLSATALEDARRRNARFGERTAYLQADLTQRLMNINDHVFQAGIMFAVDGFLSKEGKEMLYREMVRVYEPGASLYTSNLINYSYFQTLMEWLRIEGIINPEGLAEARASMMQSADAAKFFDLSRSSGVMHDADLELQTQMLYEAGFATVEYTHELGFKGIEKPFGVVIKATTPTGT